MTNLLDLSGKDLEREIEKIAKENPPRYRFWSQKEMDVVRKLHEKGVPPKAIAKAVGRSLPSVNYLITKSPYY